MKTIALVVVAAAFSAGPAKEAPIKGVQPAPATFVVERFQVAQGQDPADSIYRAGRTALSRGEFSRAAELFERVVERYPGASNAGEAMYYLAFSLYRVGGTEKLRQARRTLIRLQDTHPAVARRDAASLATRICGELARRGDEECAGIVTETAKGPSNPTPATGASCPTGDQDDERVEALNALLQMDAERALPVLEKVLARRDPCSAVLRRKAVFLVSQKRTPQAADILLRLARNDPDREVREQAVFWLSQVSDDRAVEMLQDILRTSQDREIQKKALFSLGQHRSGKGAASLREYALRNDAPEELRGEAIFWLGQKPSTENNEFLRSLYSRVTSEDLKDKVIFSLAQRRNSGNEKWLMDIVTNQREPVEMRKKALFWAGQSGVDIAELIPFYARLQDREMKEQMIFVLSQRKSGAAVDKLVDIAKNDRDPELRKKAIFWLGGSRDPRAQQFLLDIINR